MSEEAEELGRYRTHDLRMTLVWRSICFRTEEERKAWNPQEKIDFDAEQALQV